MFQKRISEEIISKARSLREQGLSYKEIGNQLGISKTSVECHTNPLATLQKKIRKVKQSTKKWNSNIDTNFNYKTFIKEYGENPNCYISGSKISLIDSNTYSLDHIVPLSRGGSSSLRNVKPCLAIYNYMKGFFKIEDFLKYCYIIYCNLRQKKCLQKMPKIISGNNSSIKKIVYTKVRRALRKEENKSNVLEITDELLKKYQNFEKIKCYLSGAIIDIKQDKYHLDHIEPIYNGGETSASNLSIVHPYANKIKYTLTIKELKHHLEIILKHNKMIN